MYLDEVQETKKAALVTVSEMLRGGKKTPKTPAECSLQWGVDIKGSANHQNNEVGVSSDNLIWKED